jgi:hypothetical protein
MTRRIPIAVAVTLGLALAVACTPASDQPSAEDAFCDSLATFGDSVQAISDLDPQTDSVEDAQAAAETAEDAWADVLVAAEGIEAADTAALDAAWSDLSQTIATLPSDAPIADNWETVQASVDEVQGAYGEIRDGVGCAEE